jgi:hypothetical protein
MLTDVVITPVSGNAKTGPIAVTGRDRTSCPLSCTFNPLNPDGVGGCYTSGRIDAFYSKNKRDWSDGDAESRLAQARSDRLRDRVDGDVLTDGEIDHGYLVSLTKAAIASGMRWIWGYTHVPTVTADDVPDGYTMNASCETVDDIRAADARGLPSVLATDEIHHGDKVDGRPVIQCPATRSDKIDCSNCGGSAGPICARPNREAIVLFPLHGSGKRKAAESIRMRG